MIRVKHEEVAKASLSSAQVLFATFEKEGFGDCHKGVFGEFPSVLVNQCLKLAACIKELSIVNEAPTLPEPHQLTRVYFRGCPLLDLSFPWRNEASTLLKAGRLLESFWIDFWLLRVFAYLTNWSYPRQPGVAPKVKQEAETYSNADGKTREYSFCHAHLTPNVEFSGRRQQTNS